MQTWSPLQLVHNAMPGIDDVRPIDDADSACLAEVEQVLRRHGAEHRFGLALLHRHFELRPGEVLVERVDAESRTLVARPMARADLSDEKLVATIWVCGGSSARECEKFCPENEGQHQGRKDHY